MGGVVDPAGEPAGWREGSGSGLVCDVPRIGTYSLCELGQVEAMGYPVLHRAPVPKAPEVWRTPRPGGVWHRPRPLRNVWKCGRRRRNPSHFAIIESAAACGVGRLCRDALRQYQDRRRAAFSGCMGSKRQRTTTKPIRDSRGSHERPPGRGVRQHSGALRTGAQFTTRWRFVPVPGSSQGSSSRIRLGKARYAA